MRRKGTSSIESHLFLSLIWARTLKMPVPYPTYTRTSSHNHTCSAVEAQIISLRSDDLVQAKQAQLHAGSSQFDLE